MSLETALNRAAYRHFDRMHFLAIRHYNRSGRRAYYERAERIAALMQELAPKCEFKVPA